MNYSLLSSDSKFYDLPNDTILFSLVVTHQKELPFVNGTVVAHQKNSFANDVTIPLHRSEKFESNKVCRF